MEIKISDNGAQIRAEANADKYNDYQPIVRLSPWGTLFYQPAIRGKAISKIQWNSHEMAVQEAYLTDNP